jgi:hypothetical protein
MRYFGFTMDETIPYWKAIFNRNFKRICVIFLRALFGEKGNEFLREAFGLPIRPDGEVACLPFGQDLPCLLLQDLIGKGDEPFIDGSQMSSNDDQIIISRGVAVKTQCNRDH